MLRNLRLLPIALVLITGALARTPVIWDLEVLKQQPRNLPVEKVNKWRQNKAAALFKQSGATAVSEQPVWRDGTPGPTLPVSNVVVELEGSTKDIIVIGAHLDKHYNGKGEGAVDDWSGVAAMAGLFRELRKQPVRKFTFVFVAFAYEEDGLWGSKSYVNSLSPDAVARIKAMVNLECLGVSHLHIWRNGSTPRLIDLAEKLAKLNGVKLISRDLPEGVISDSIPFSKQGIPTITFDSLKPKDFPLIHSDDDTLDKISVSAYKDGLAFILKYILEIDIAGVPIATASPGK